jgi:hypothetical protein
MPFVRVTNSFCELVVRFPMYASPAAVQHAAMSKRKNLSQSGGGFCRLHLTSSYCCLARVTFSLFHSVQTAPQRIFNSSRFGLTAASPFSRVPRSGFWSYFLLCLLMSSRRRTARGFNDTSDGYTRDSLCPANGETAEIHTSPNIAGCRQIRTCPVQSRT